MSRLLKALVRRLRAPLDLRFARKRLGQLHRRPGDIEAAVDLALQFGGRGLYKVRTTQIRSEILTLARRVAELEPETILEIGTAWGGTLLIWAQIASREVVGCDLKVKLFLRDLAPFLPPPGGCRVALIEGDTHSTGFRDRVWGRFGAGKVDFLFIDGDHSEPGVELDYRDYAGLVRPGGLIAFHDIAERQPIADNQVRRFWSRLRDVVPGEEILERPDQCGYGIGLVTVPEDGCLTPPGFGSRNADRCG
jgi:predicted O-methyltransferase YrrM